MDTISTTINPATASPRLRGDVEAARSWSDLPEGPLHTILMCLRSLVDLISFKAVCRSWRAVGSSLPSSAITSRFPPLLLFPTRCNFLRLSGYSVFDPTCPSFFSLLSRNSERFKFLALICYSHGHLLGLLNNRIAIINLFTGYEFYSPILPENDRLSNPSHRVHFRPIWSVLTCPLSSPDSGLLVFTSGPLLYWRIGSDSWSCHWPKTKIRGDLRILTMQGKVYAMDPLDHSLYILDFYPELHLRPFAVAGIQKDSLFLKHFLVDCGGELLHIRLVDNEDRLEANERDWRSRFEVFMLDLSVDRPRWVKKETLGNWAIFIGCNFKLPGLAVQNPESWGGRSNCVYIASVNKHPYPPFEVFKLGDEFDMTDLESPLNRAGCIQGLSSEWFHPGF